jgi:hypothetical protein
MFGVLFNGVAVLLSGIIGLLIKKGIPKSIDKSIKNAMGIAVIIIAINGVVSNMIKVGSDGSLHSSGELLLVVSLAIGTLLGEILKLEDRLNGLSGKIEGKFHIEGFTNGFVTASSIYCIGAMAIIGSINSGLIGDHKILITKSIIDFAVGIVLAASLGIGVMFAFIPVVLYEGSIALLAGLLSNFLVGDLLIQVCFVGYALIGCVGLNVMTNNKFKVVNMLPSIFIPVIYYGILQLLN